MNYQTLATAAQKKFSPERFVRVQDVCVFAEHETKDSKGRPQKYDREALEKIIARCNERISETEDYATLTAGHTPDEESDKPSPPVLGFVGPYRLAQIGNKKKRYAILADEWHFKEDHRTLEKLPRRSVEVWMDDDMGERFFDPVAALGAETPRLDLGVKFSRGGRVEKYSARSVHAYAKRRKDKPGEQWITIGSDRNGDGESEGGGQAVRIDKDGNITAGPDWMAKDGIKNVKDFGKQDGKKKAKPTKPKKLTPDQAKTEIERHLADNNPGGALKSLQGMTKKELSEILGGMGFPAYGNQKKADLLKQAEIGFPQLTADAAADAQARADASRKTYRVREIAKHIAASNEGLAGEGGSYGGKWHDTNAEMHAAALADMEAAIKKAKAEGHTGDKVLGEYEFARKKLLESQPQKTSDANFLTGEEKKTPKFDDKSGEQGALFANQTSKNKDLPGQQYLVGDPDFEDEGEAKPESVKLPPSVQEWFDRQVKTLKDVKGEIDKVATLDIAGGGRYAEDVLRNRRRDINRAADELKKFVKGARKEGFDGEEYINQAAPGILKSLGIKLKAKNNRPHNKSRYAALPGGSNTFIPTPGTEKERHSMAVDDEGVRQVIAAIAETPEWKWLTSQVDKDTYEEADDTPPVDEMGDDLDDESSDDLDVDVDVDMDDEEDYMMPGMDMPGGEDKEQYSDDDADELPEPHADGGSPKEVEYRKTTYGRKERDLVTKYRRAEMEKEALKEKYARMEARVQRIERDAEDERRDNEIDRVARDFVIKDSVLDAVRERALYSRGGNMSSKAFKHELGMIVELCQPRPEGRSLPIGVEARPGQDDAKEKELYSRAVAHAENHRKATGEHMKYEVALAAVSK